MSEIERLVVRVEANVQQMEKALKSVNRSMYATQRETQKSLDRMKRDMDRAGRDMAQSLQPVQFAAQAAFAAISLYAIKAAGDAAEVGNAFNVAFGDGAKAAREFADELSNRVGRSTTQVQQQMTQLRLVLDGLGLSGEKADAVVRGLTERAVDIGSLFNVEDADAFRAIISGISGETEPMKRFGVVVNETAVKAELLRLGFQGSSTEASEAAKAIARTNIILARTAVAAGDAENTQDSFNNQLKRARAEFHEAAIALGTQLLPAVTEITKATTGAIEAFTDLPEGVQIAGLALLGLAAASGPIAAVITGLGRLISVARLAKAELALLGGGAAAGGAGGRAAGAAAAGAAGGVAASRAGWAARLGVPAGLLVGLASFAKAPPPADAPLEERWAWASAQPGGPSPALKAEFEAAGMAGAVRHSRGQRQKEEDFLAGLGGFSLDGVNPNAGTTRGRGGRRDNSEAQADRRMALDLERQILEARAAGDDAGVKAAEERLRLLELARQFEAAGASDAMAEAQNFLALENAAAEMTERREKAEMAVFQAVDMVAGAFEGLAANEARAVDASIERLRYAAEIARLEGDPDRMKAAERELWIRERTNELLERKLELTAADAEARAAREFEAYDSADVKGRMREDFRSAFRDGIRAAIDGDVGDMFSSLADRFTDRMLDNLADDLFNLLAQAAGSFKLGGGGGGGGLLGTALGFVGGLFGFREKGGPVSAGRPYIVGEKRPEVFVPNVSGRIMPSVEQAAASLGGRRGLGSSLTYSPTIDARGAGLGVVREVKRLLDEQNAALPGLVSGVAARREKYRLGRRRK